MPYRVISLVSRKFHIQQVSHLPDQFVTLILRNGSRKNNMTEKDPSYQDLANYEDWAEIQLVMLSEALRSVESVIDKLKLFQTAVITKLEKFCPT